MSETVTKYIENAMAKGFVGPEAIAAAVFEVLTDQEKYDLVKDLLHELVRDRLRQTRRIPDVDPNQRNPDILRARVRVNTRYGNQADRLNAILDGQFFTESGWKQLRNMTHDDLLYVAKQRRSQADALNGEADRLERLAQLLEKSKKPTVGSLPAVVLLRT